MGFKAYVANIVSNFWLRMKMTKVSNPMRFMLGNITFWFQRGLSAHVKTGNLNIKFGIFRCAFWSLF